MIEIDGSYGEGGGQILRSSLALAAVVGKELRVFNIRAGRAEPGLKAQHLTGARAVAQMCSGTHQGLEIGATEFVFKPGPLIGGSFRFDVGTAGSVTLVLQALMPLFPFAARSISVEVSGGTDVKWSPPIDYLSLVTIPILAKMGVDVSLRLIRRGHYPKGGGLVRLVSSPTGSVKSINGSNAGRVSSVMGLSHCAKLPKHVAERQAVAAAQMIKLKGLPDAEIQVEAAENSSRLSPGSGIVLRAKTENSAIIGGDCLGERQVPAEEIGRVGAQRLLEEIESDCFLDRHMGDIIVPYMAIAEGVSDVSVSQVTQHALTNVRISEQVAGVKFGLLGDLGKPGRLRVKGLGLRSNEVAASPRESRPIADF